MKIQTKLLAWILSGMLAVYLLSFLFQQSRNIKEISAFSSKSMSGEEGMQWQRVVARNIAAAVIGVRDANVRIAQTAPVSKSMAQDLTGINAAVTETRANEEQNACYAAIEDTLACYTDRYGPPAPGVRVVPHLLSVTEKECGFTRIADELGF